MDTAFQTAALWIFCGLFAVLPIVHLCRSAGGGELDMAAAVGIAFVLIIVAIRTAMSAGTPQMYALLALMVLVGVGAPWAGTQYSRALHRQLDDGLIEKYRAALQRDSRNSGAHALLAEAYLKDERYTEAVTHYEAALALSSDAGQNPHFQKWTRHLKQAREEQTTRAAKRPRRVRS